MVSQQITPHFYLEEFMRHGKPDLAGLEQDVPYPGKWVSSRLLPLCKALEVIRAELGGKSVTILSGYRDPKYNSAIGGAKYSQHMFGRAADIKVAGVGAAKVQIAVRKLYKAGAIKIGGLGSYLTFTHVDIRPSATLVEWVGSGMDSVA
jgi:uncharacterized protein YcbK (DUF882 family)